MASSNFRISLPAFSSLIALALLVITSLATSPASAQQSLTRISSAERSDGLGHVMRFHMASAVDSFTVRQPFVDLIQIQLFKQGIDKDQIRIFETHSPYLGLELIELPDGLGMNIHLEGGEFFVANAYPDANGRDLLLGLTRTGETQLRKQVENVRLITWPDAGLADLDGAYDLDTTSHYHGDWDEDAFDMFEFDDFSNEGLKFEVVVIDPGHGGRDPGAIGYGGVYEKDITLAVALKLGTLIEERLEGIKVVYTRDDDSFVELEERGRIANRAQGDLFISLHGNSNHSRQPSGAEVYILGLTRSKEALEIMKKENSVIRFEAEGERSEELTNEELAIYELANIGNIASSEVFAGLAERQFAERARRRSRGVKQAPFIVLYHASMPAALVELGFISNPQEKQFLTSEYGQTIMASAIFRAVRDYKEMIERSQGNNP